jgi:hypothetical protein
MQTTHDIIVSLEVQIASLRFNIENARQPNARWVQKAQWKLAALTAQLEAAYAAVERLQPHS